MLRVVQWATGTVGRRYAVAAIAPVCAAAPGIRTFRDPPTVVGKGVLNG
ncbi:MAG: hypothetical protein QOH27_666 [Mycobacterium sp.]|jgi:hypothetical protein|nr:hypothetical protein [Mycobacterium sp.]